MIPLFRVHVPSTVVHPLTQTLLSGWIGQGPRVAEFEKKLGKWTGTKYNLALNSCTSALHLAYHLAGVGPGTEVITTPVTCTATNLPLLSLGATIRWADVNPDTGLIDEDDALSLINRRTRAVVAVDWGGTPAVIPSFWRRVHEASDRVKVIEDAAHAFGAMWEREEVGTLADLTCFSFQAIKHLTTGDGGLLTARDKDDYERGRLLRWYGLDREAAGGGSSYDQLIADPGYKFHMNDITATIGLEQLKYVREILVKHRHAATYYRYQFKVRKMKRVRPAPLRPQAHSSWWLFTILCDDRDELMSFLKERGIAASPVHRRNDEHPCFKEFSERALPGVDRFTSRQCAIPCGWWLEDEHLRYIMNAISDYDRKER